MSFGSRWVQKIEKVLQFLASLKLAVINLVMLALISAIGTFVESYYDLEHAQEWVYRSFYMKLALTSLSINLIAVLVHRWPWKKKHISFISAHFGILLMIVGSMMTQELGVDGSMRLEVNEKSQSIILPSKILSIYSSFDGNNIREIYRDAPRFIIRPPSKKNPYIIPLGAQEMRITDYRPYALQKVVYSPKENSGWFLSFTLMGSQAQISESIYKMKKQPYIKNPVGLTHIVLGTSSYKPQEKNELILIPQNKKEVMYHLVRENKIQKSGFLKKGQQIETGWMDLKFQILDFYPAERIYEWIPLKSSQENSVSVIQVEFANQEKWMPLNSFLSFYSKDLVYTVGYMNQRRNIGSFIQLLDFKIQRYMGSTRAKEYESVVMVDGQKKITISMNEPLMYKGWTFYQSSFEEDDNGKIQASILAVNRDPGRWVKYLGSFLIVLGIFALFYLRREKF